jgi:hypothetical protein
LTVWLLSTLTSERLLRRAARAAAGAALCVAWLVGCAPASHAKAAPGANALREKDVRRAEKVVAQLRLLDGAGAAASDVVAFRSLTRKLYPGLFITVADMRQSDLKTDLDTAVFLYEEVGRTWAAAGETAADCGRERPDVYLPLCLGLRGGTARQLLLAKARLHARWAEAVVGNYRGAGDAETVRALSEMRAARGNDLSIAARVVETLKPLEGLANIPRSYADYEEQRAVSKVSFERLDGEFADALGRAGALLNWMPRSPSFYYLSSARRSYADGLFWYQKVHRARRMVVSASGFERDPLKDLWRDAEQVGYTVVVNWRTAVKYTRLAEQSLPAEARH